LILYTTENLTETTEETEKEETKKEETEKEETKAENRAEK